MHVFNGSLAGEFLKRWREGLNFSQQELTTMLEYKNVNFVSMIERGMAKVPADRIKDFARVYMIPQNVFTALILKCSYPETWELIEQYNEASGIASVEETNKNFNDWWLNQSKKYNLSENEWNSFIRNKEHEKQKKLKSKIKQGEANI